MPGKLKSTNSVIRLHKLQHNPTSCSKEEDLNIISAKDCPQGKSVISNLVVNDGISIVDDDLPSSKTQPARRI